ncbi:MAG: hypothetical protein KDA41_17295 [Planctomycetales bacterium]|nr:hypothetical protein [Planctomycetales bacterium]
MTAPFPILRGATLTLGLRARRGTLTGNETVRAALKAAPNGVAPGLDAAEAAVFTATFVAASGSTPAYWALTLSAAQTAALAKGAYATDMRVEVSGVVTYSPVLMCEASDPVTGAAS